MPVDWITAMLWSDISKWPVEHCTVSMTFWCKFQSLLIFFQCSSILFCLKALVALILQLMCPLEKGLCSIFRQSLTFCWNWLTQLRVHRKSKKQQCISGHWKLTASSESSLVPPSPTAEADFFLFPPDFPICYNNFTTEKCVHRYRELFHTYNITQPK
jgi:hypothetical protein